jgi:carrier protein
LGVALKVAVAATIHPVEYAKTLIQIGYEPLAPTHTKTLITGRPALALPSIFR